MVIPRVWTAVLGLTAGVLAACADSTGPLLNTPLTLSASAGMTSGGLAVGGPALAEIIESDGENTLVISRVAMVLREVELRRTAHEGCDIPGPGDDEACEEFEAGPLLLELPLGGGPEIVVAVDVPPDTYDRLEFDFHKPDDDSPEDRAFLASHPEFKGISTRVEGSWNGVAFVFLQDLNEEQEVSLQPPLVVGQDSEGTNLTLSLDVRTWFRDAQGVLLDPRSAGKGGKFEDLVEGNIRRSIEVFEDPRREGRRNP